MARPKKQRIIEGKPQYLVFKPEGISEEEIEEICIGLDELEALRLTNLEELSQEETAQRMGVSRQLVGLMLSNARKKITEALFFAKAIKIQGEKIEE